jgi:hypothetical protein
MTFTKVKPTPILTAIKPAISVLVFVSLAVTAPLFQAAVWTWSLTGAGALGLAAGPPGAYQAGRCVRRRRPKPTFARFTVGLSSNGRDQSVPNV